MQISPQTHDLRLTGDGSVVEDMVIEAAYDGERDQLRNLLQEGGVLFTTPKGKKFFLKYSEFAFIINRRAPAPEATEKECAA